MDFGQMVFLLRRMSLAKIQLLEIIIRAISSFGDMASSPRGSGSKHPPIRPRLAEKTEHFLLLPGTSFALASGLGFC